MARPSDLLNVNAARVLACLEPIAAAAKTAPAADRAALSYLLDAGEYVAAWRRNLTETDRRKAYGAACAAEALALANAYQPATLQGGAVRRALGAYAAALKVLLDGEPVKAVRAAEGAALSVRARYANTRL
ncbi:hypothetical protein CcrKarma_gp352 [Caulobacter virus Karma]|uniref:Uncharacterized protein n=6 Tax=Viruses TaxID=10239 RepID=J3SL22_9CAUD|nr:hypothetical protein D865_gp019 [Caulobacter phage phiCbK]YP_006988233.1 hypothetical protein D865_gp081 [Caulobacter phage phiCbK]YP_006988700.1 hypothetical protein CcrMagneto_gp018 [Caulobacter virus Magneto]YP_006989028.1 hypothetical protein CcrMagneto_gp346 [Caulobacter virus Magneto]YP_006989399.1 hypothetical protein CcrKarma_gp019 [Caulobacter virus Karma]YP_006989732.1 hypothetical protein CcrKarma_gp352 [Caulobacter virus Karma]YP_006989750.1 hypothetical protein D870_gp017 [Cau